MKVVNKEKIFEIIRYLIVGVMTTVVSFVVYYGLVSTILNPENPIFLQIANVISWIVSVLFAYVTNRIFVFKSKSEHKIKEFASFVGSRLLTLFMDMILMFLGVSVLALNDKIVKLFSQGLVIIFNYIFSKLFVFQSEKRLKKDFSKVVHFLLKGNLFFLPGLFTFVYLFPYEVLQCISFAFMIFFFFFFSFSLLVHKKNLVFLFLLYGFLFLYLLYSYCNQLNVVLEAFFLLQILFLPLSALYFYHQKSSLFSASFLTKIFFFHIFLGFFCHELFLGVLILFLPVSLEVLRKHHNYIAKIIGLFLILCSILFLKSSILTLYFCLILCFQMWKERETLKKDSFWFCLSLFFLFLSVCFTYLKPLVFDIDTISFSYQTFLNANLEEQMFGITNLNDLILPLTGIDVIDIFYHIGLVGTFFYLFFMGYAFFHIRLKSYQKLGFLFGIFSGFIMGHIFIGFISSLFFGLLCSKDIWNQEKKILLVSNMYPSFRFKHYGSFVKNTKELLEQQHFLVDLVCKKKQNTFLGTFIHYGIFYAFAFYKSVFYSYDFIYVHFISHSTFPVLFGKIFSKNTKLILNVHGNDIVSDSKRDEVNVIRSKKVLPYADLCVVPSVYFQNVLVNEYHFPLEKIRIFPSSGISTSIFYEKDRDECVSLLSLDSQYSYFGYVSRIEEGKGYDVLLKAIFELKQEKLFEHKKLLVIGSGSLQSDFDDLVLKYDLKEQVKQIPFVFQKDLVNYYNVMDVFLFPTKRKSESLGLVGLEAMACKTFVIGCDLYGPSEYLENGKTALTYQKDEDLVLQIKTFLKMKKSEKDSIILAAYEKALEYDVEILGVKLAQIFDEES